MKIMIYVSMILCCSAGVTAATLMPASHYVCETFQAEREVMMSCADGRKFYSDQNGRCGCLFEQEVTPAEVCIAALINCNEEEGATFSSLYQDLIRCGPTQNVYVGCGCYYTQS